MEYGEYIFAAIGVTAAVMALCALLSWRRYRSAVQRLAVLESSQKGQPGE